MRFDITVLQNIVNFVVNLLNTRFYFGSLNFTAMQMFITSATVGIAVNFFKKFFDY